MKPSRLFSDPRNWPTALMVGFVRLLIRLPHGWLLALGAALGRAAGRLARDRALVAAINLKACFPQLDDAARAELLRANLAATGTGLMEAAMAYWGSDRRLKPLVDFRGENHLADAYRAGRGVIVLVAHFTTVELACRLVNLRGADPILLLGREHNQPLLNELITAARERHCERVLEKKDLVGLRRVLKTNRAVLYAPDQNFTYQSVFAPFFGIAAATVTATSQMADRSGAALVPMWCIRDPSGRYRIDFEEPWDDFPSGDAVADATRINAWIEARIRERPEQYLWVHRRFKTRPSGEPPFYPPSARRAKDR